MAGLCRDGGSQVRQGEVHRFHGPCCDGSLTRARISGRGSTAERPRGVRLWQGSEIEVSRPGIRMRAFVAEIMQMFT